MEHNSSSTTYIHTQHITHELTDYGSMNSIAAIIMLKYDERIQSHKYLNIECLHEYQEDPWVNGSSV